MTPAAVIVVPPVPTTFRWNGTPLSSAVEDGHVDITVGARTDWFVDPRSGEATLNTAALVGALDGDFALSARVEVTFQSTFDAGALVLWRDEATWAKLAFEYSPQGQPMVVSVVTRGESDDCNSMAVSAGAVWLRIARLGAAYAFHASTDGKRWQFVRHFRLGATHPAEVGFEAQSPLGHGCTAHFSDIVYSPDSPEDLRDGR
jgi:regulation of enolase protein 1 (concanavalin A-like superfamily)